MEIDWTFLLSAIYCGLGVIYVTLGMLFGGTAQNRKKLETDMSEHPFRTLIVALIIMTMVTLFWLPSLIWELLFKEKIQEGKS